MGIYINPKDMLKEEWLVKHGQLIPQPKTFRTEDEVVVCLVDNGAFTAAGIAYSQRELEAFLYPDGRPRTWWLVPISSLGEFIQPEDIDQ